LIKRRGTVSAAVPAKMLQREIALCMSKEQLGPFGVD
jgi:hypothetical protein